MLTGCFLGLDSATLSTLKTNYLNAITAVAVAGQSYAIGGRSFTRANLAELQKALKEIQFAQSAAAGTAVRRTVGRYRNASY